MEKYAMYLRKSQFDRDYENLSVEETLKRHQSILSKLAKDRKYFVEKIYDEVVSGETIAARPKVQELLNDVSQNKYAGVLVIDIDRLARGNSVDQGIISQTFQFTGTKIVTPTKTYDPLNEFDEEYFEFGLFMSRREYKTITRRLIRGRQISASEGKYVGGTSPYGYKVIKLEKEKGYTLEIVPEEAEVVQKMFELFNNGWGGNRIANYLNKALIPTRYKAKYWTHSTVLKIINNPVYIGKIKRGQQKESKTIENGVVVKTRKYIKDINEIELYDGLHPAIISEEIFYTAQEVMKTRTNDTKVKKDTEIKNAFAGLLFCKYCGRGIRRCTHKTNKGQQERFICTMTAICENHSADYQVVETAIIQNLKAWYDDFKVKISAEDNSRKELDEFKSYLARLNKEIDELNLQLNNAYSFLEKGIYTIEIFQQRKAILDKDIAELVNRKNSISNEIEQIENQSDNRLMLLPKTEKLLDSFYSLTRKEQNDLLKEILSKIVYAKEPNGDIKIEIYPRFSNF